MCNAISGLAAVAAIWLLAACSGADQPPPLEDTDDAPKTVTDSLSTTDAGATNEVGCEEGATQKCVAPVAFEAGGYVRCVTSAKVCSGGQWTACGAHPTAAAGPTWQPEDVGCAWPPQSCEREGAGRTCRKELGATSYTANCTYVTEVCFGGTWLTCSPEATR